MRTNSLIFLLTTALSTVASAQVVSEQTVVRVGQTSFSSAASESVSSEKASQLLKRNDVLERDLVAARRASIRRSAFDPLAAEPFAAPQAGTALSNPDPAPKDVVGTLPSFSGFSGLTSAESAKADGFVYEPPDQGLGIGNNLVLEAVNLAVAVYDTSGALLLGPAPLSALLGVAPGYNSKTGRYGPSFSDPRAYFDQGIRRWFVTSLELDVDPKTGNLTGRSHVYIAVSTDSLPFSFKVFAIDTTDDGQHGTPAHSGCPCFPDQPLIGADRYGFYISANEFSLFNPVFNGAQIYALSKAFLAGEGSPTVVHYGELPLAEGIAYSVQPASSVRFRDERPKGVEYFLSSLDFQGTLDNRIAVWQLTNTASLNNAHPSLTLSHQVIKSEVYGIPPNAVQPSGPFPLGMSVGDPLEMVDTNDDRMNQVVYEHGRLWAGVNTIVGRGESLRAGIAYFVVDPGPSSSGLSARMAKQGYVSGPGDDSVMFPAIGVTPSGKAAMVFTLVGPTGNVLFPFFYPSMAFTTLSASRGAGDIQLGAAGFAPDDGFSGYPKFGGHGSGRWGDYSAAVADTDGSIWMATEWIPGTRPSTYANWGTFIGQLQ